MLRKLPHVSVNYKSQKFTYFIPPYKLSKRTFNECINVNAFDHDGCLGLRNMEPTEVKDMHTDVITYLKQQKLANDYTTEYVTSSSNRQSIRLDCLNALYNQNNLAFPVIKALAKTLDAWFDPLLLADITANRKPGFTVNCASNIALANKIDLTHHRITDSVIEKLLKTTPPEYTFSEDKINIIYAQIHRTSMLHPNKNIHINIYDDLIDKVLNPLSHFYRNNTDLIPSNVRLNFHYFSTTHSGSLNNSFNLPEFVCSINGAGSTDTDYYRTVRMMEEIALIEEGKTDKYHMSQYITSHAIHALSRNVSPLQNNRR